MVAEFTQAEALDDLLSRFHFASMSWPQRVSSRLPGKSPGVGDYLVSRQYDDDNGALYDDEERVLVGKIEFAILQIPEPGRSALYANARSLCLGTTAITSPRLPPDQRARAEILDAARALLMTRLAAVGVL